VSANRSGYRTKGLSVLSPDEQRQLRALLRRTGGSVRRVHTREGDELVLLKITATGVIPQIIRFLKAVGADLIDRSIE